MGTLTYDDYAAMPDDGRRYELIEGELHLMPSPGTRHQMVLGGLIVIIDEHVRGNGLGIVMLSPFDVILSANTVPQPDIVYVNRERERLLTERALEGAPTLAVEILLASERERDLVLKRRIYREHGIPHYWIVDPERKTLEGLVLGEKEYESEATFSGDEEARLRPFPNLVIPLADIWPPEFPD